MDYREVTGGREFLARMDYGADWRDEVVELATAEGVDAAVFTATGSVQDAVLRYWDRAEAAFRTAEFNEPLDVAACHGTVAHGPGDADAVDADALRADATVVLSRRSGQALAGRLEAATVHAGELYLREFQGRLERSVDDVTDLPLLEL
ncbi:MAG: PPC domain-containing DNA-binding protein [Halobacteriaceae archaeon]